MHNYYTSWVVKSPELCPSQSSCRKRKRSQVMSLSSITFSPEIVQREKVFKKKSNVTAGVGMEWEGKWAKSKRTQENRWKMQLFDVWIFGYFYSRGISCPAVRFTAALQELIFISIWIQYLSSGPWPCLILLLCSAAQMHSDPERWRATQRHPHTHNKG